MSTLQPSGIILNIVYIEQLCSTLVTGLDNHVHPAPIEIENPTQLGRPSNGAKAENTPLGPTLQSNLTYQFPYDSFP
jgi:hypothetical protein